MACALLLAMLLLAWRARGAQGQGSKWVSTNPGAGGAVNSPVLTLQHGYWAVGSDLSGVYLSKDRGASWRQVGAADGLTVTHVSSMAAHPSGKLFVGTDDGIFVGKEDGTRVRKVYPTGYISALVVADANPNIMYAAMHPQYDGLDPVLLRSNNAGESWARVSQNLPSNLRVLGLRVHRVDYDAVIVLSGNGRFNHGPKVALRSEDGGKTFVQLAAEVGGAEILDMVYGTDPKDLNIMYLTTYRNFDTGSMWISYDAGSNWRRLAFKSGVFLLDAVKPSHLRLLESPFLHTDGRWDGESMMWESNDGGKSWKGYNPEDAFTPAWGNGWKTWGMGSGYQGEVQTWGWDPATPSIVLWTDAAGVLSSLDGGKSWKDVTSCKAGSGWISTGFENVIAVVVAPSPVNPNLVYAGYYDIGLWRSDDGGGSWTTLADRRFSGSWGEVVGGCVFTVLPDPARLDVVWAGLGGNQQEQMYMVRSTNRGKTWARATSGLPGRIMYLQGLSLDPSSSKTSRRVFFAGDGVVYRSTNDGLSWTKVLSGPYCVVTNIIAGAVYAGGSGGLWRSTRGGDPGTWSKMALPTTGWSPGVNPLEGGYVGLTDITADNEGRLWAAVLGVGFYRTAASNGNTWTLVRPDSFARSVAVDSSTGWVYTGSSSAVSAGGYDSRSNGVVIWDGKSWKSMNTGLAWPFATMVRVVSGAKWVASPGVGVARWR